jgi:hypothetical protein
MAEHGPHRDPIRRYAFRVALIIIPLVALAFAVPKVVAWLKRDRAAAGLGVLHADPPPERPADRPADEGEVRKSRGAEERLAKAQEVWKDATTIAPSEPVTDVSGEKVRWFHGFGVSVESKPAGAQVLVDGQDVGRTPVVSSVTCDPGDEVHIEVRKPPRRAQQRITKCREDQLVEIRVELK